MFWDYVLAGAVVTSPIWILGALCVYEAHFMNDQ